MLEKTRMKVLPVLLALMVLLPLSTTVMQMGLNPPLIGASSSATIALDVSEGYVGDYVTVRGSGFKPDKDVTFTWGDNNFDDLGFISNMPKFQRPSVSVGGRVRTDALGNFVVQLQVPKLTSGTYTVRATDTENSATASFTIKPLIKLRNEYAYKTHGSAQTPEDFTSSAYYIDFFLAEGFVGDWLALQLSGFGEGEIVEVKIGTINLDNFTVGSGTQQGYLFSTTAKRVPEMPGGNYTVVATGKISGITASTSFKVKPELFLASPPPGPTLSQFPWVYSFADFGKSWYSSVNITANSAFVFEATGLSGTSIQNVTVVYSGGTPIECQVTGTLTIQDGSTQGINASTVPFASGSPFTAGLSPNAKIPSAIPGGKMLNITITTVGAGGASFTFTNQLFSSSVGAKYTDGVLRWVEGDSTISSNGTGLSGMVGDVNKLVATGCNGTGFKPAIVYSTGSTVNKIDLDALYPLGLTSFTPVSFFDANGNGVWDSNDPVYNDADASGNVTINDYRLTLQTIGGIEYLPWTLVVSGNPDLGRTLIEFPAETRTSSAYLLSTWVYLDKYGTGVVSEGDTRISTVLFQDPLWLWPTLSADANGFVALTLDIPSIPGADLTYDVRLWNSGGPVHVRDTVTMQILTNLEVTSAPTRYQSTHYVTEGSQVTISGDGFFGAEPLTMSAGGKYVTTLTPNSYGVLSSTTITMPALAGGEQQIMAQGIFTAENTASTNVTFTPALSVSPTTGYNLNPVTSIMVTGKGFEAGTYQIVFDGAGIGEAVISAFTVTDTGDEAGQINIAFNLPEGVEGVHIVDVVKTSDPTKSAFYGESYFETDADLRSGVSSLYPYPTDSEFPAVTIYPSLQRTPTSATVGTLVTITGKGLQPSTTYYIWYDPRGTSPTTTSQAILMTTTPATVATDAKGTLTASFKVPQCRGGTRYVWVSTSPTYITKDPVLPGPSLVYTYISIQPALVLTPTSGPVNTTVSVSISGLRTGSQYQLWWYKPEEPKWAGEIPSTALPLTSLTGDQYGNSTEAVSFTVPATAEVNTIYAVDLSYFGNRYTILATPVFFIVGKVSTRITLSLTPTTVTRGENVTINGFIEPAMSVNVTLYITDPDGTLTNKTVVSTPSGTFTDSFKPDKPGTWQVIAKWDGDAVYAGYTSLGATVTVKPVDMSGTYALTGLIVGIVALVLGLILTLYFIRKRRVAPSAT
jgi:hypothetical protein